MLDYDEVQLAGDGELFIKSPYLTYDPKATRVLSYVLYRGTDEEFAVDYPNGLKPGWRRAKTAKVARAEVLKEYPRILEENAAGDNVFFRVDRPVL